MKAESAHSSSFFCFDNLIMVNTHSNVDTTVWGVQGGTGTEEDTNLDPTEIYDHAGSCSHLEDVTDIAANAPPEGSTFNRPQFMEESLYDDTQSAIESTDNSKADPDTARPESSTYAEAYGRTKPATMANSEVYSSISEAEGSQVRPQYMTLSPATADGSEEYTTPSPNRRQREYKEFWTPPHLH